MRVSKIFSEFSLSRPKIYHYEHFGKKISFFLEFQITNLIKLTKNIDTLTQLSLKKLFCFYFFLTFYFILLLFLLKVLL